MEAGFSVLWVYDIDKLIDEFLPLLIYCTSAPFYLNLQTLNQIVMEAINKKKLLWLTILRWSARIIALLIVLFSLAMFIGESTGGRSAGAPPLQTRDYIILSLWALFIIGLIIGLWREGLGGLISLVFMTIHIIILQMEGATSVIFFVMLLPSILYILSWYFHRRWARQQLN